MPLKRNGRFYVLLGKFKKFGFDMSPQAEEHGKTPESYRILVRSDVRKLPQLLSLLRREGFRASDSDSWTLKVWMFGEPAGKVQRFYYRRPTSGDYHPVTFNVGFLP